MAKSTKHSARFDMVKGFYPRTWSEARVYKAVECCWITDAEYEEIVGEAYVAESE